MWKCPGCGNINDGKVCISCGRKRPLEQNQSKRSNSSLIIWLVIVSIVFAAIVVCLTAFFVNHSGNKTKVVSTDQPTPTAAATDQTTYTTPSKSERLYDNQDMFIETVKKQLKVPKDANVDCEIGDPYRWEAAEMEVAHVSFTQNGELVAFADCDVVTGEIARGICMYTPPKKKSEYSRYHNERYGFSLDVPTFLEHKDIPDNGDGAIFYDGSGEVELSAYGCHAAGLQDYNTIDSLYQTIKNSVDYKVTYDAKKDNWFVLSGESDGNIVYEKYVLKSDETYNCFCIVYPKHRKKEFDEIVTHINKSFKTGVGYDSSSER